jgi:hypothetical protein
MDAFKFAFETTIVGLLALPWLVLLVLLLSPEAARLTIPSTGPFAKLFEPTAFGVTIVTFAYFMGSAITPVATQLLDDPDMPMLQIRQIRTSALAWWLIESPSIVRGGPLFVKMCQPFGTICDDALELQESKDLTSTCDRRCIEMANGQFLFEEQAILKDGTDKIERLNRLHEQVIVLRAAVLNGLILVVLTWYAFFSRGYKEPLRKILSDSRTLADTITTVAMAIALLWVGAQFGSFDYIQNRADDPPIMEGLLVLLGLVGFWTFLKGVLVRCSLQVLLLSAFITLLAYGGWWWTEFLYSREVIGAFAARF